MQVKKKHLELDMEQQTGSKSGKEYIKAMCYSPCLFNLYAEYIMTNAGLESTRNHKLESRLLGEISITSHMQMMHQPYDRKQRRAEEPLDKSEKEE